MFKKALIPLMVAGMALGAQAGDYAVEANPSQVFVGFDAGYSQVQGSHLTDANYKTGGVAYGLRLGAQNTEWRTMVTVDRFMNKEAGYLLGQIHTDYLFHILDGYTAMGIKPFLGLNGGYGNYEAKGGIDENGLTYGGEAGVIFDATENIDIDLMAQYSLSSAAAFDHAANVKMGINYKY